MSNYFTSITLGMGLGFLLCAAGTQITNAHAQTLCKDKTDSHQVVYVKSFMGSNYACVDRKYL